MNGLGHVLTKSAKLRLARKTKINALEAMHFSSQGICIFNKELSCSYSNKKACHLFQQSLGLQDTIQKVCCQLLTDSDGSSLFQYSGAIKHQHLTFHIRCFSYTDQTSRQYIAVIFENIAEPGETMSSFTEREKEVLELLRQGKKNKDIAKILVISDETVKTHIKHIFEKTHTNSRTELIAKLRDF